MSDLLDDIWMAAAARVYLRRNPVWIWRWLQAAGDRLHGYKEPT